MANESANLKGVFTALVTPFREGRVDEDSYRKLVEYQIEEEVDGLVVNGTTAESPTLDLIEVERLFKLTRKIVEESGKPIPLVMGTGSNCTRKTLETTVKARDWGADAALVVTPYYNKPPQRGLVEHFSTVADKVDLPLLLYNVPGRTITSLELKTITELAGHSRIVGIKEATGDLKFGKQVIDSVPKGFLVTSGDDGTCMALAELGGQGVISVCSNLIAKPMARMLKKFWAGETKALGEFEKYQKFISQLYTEANPIPVKMALYLKGIIQSPEMRLPLVELDSRYVAGLKMAMQELELVHE